MKKFLYYWFPLIAWCWLIFYMSSIPNLKSSFGLWDYILRKFAHMGEFFALFLLARRAFGDASNGMLKGRDVTVALLFTIGYAFGDEFHQSFTPGRFPSLYDVGIDSIGAVGGGIFYVVNRIATRCEFSKTVKCDKTVKNSSHELKEEPVKEGLA